MNISHSNEHRFHILTPLNISAATCRPNVELVLAQNRSRCASFDTAFGSMCRVRWFVHIIVDEVDCALTLWCVNPLPANLIY